MKCISQRTERGLPLTYESYTLAHSVQIQSVSQVPLSQRARHSLAMATYVRSIKSNAARLCVCNGIIMDNETNDWDELQLTS
jgi:hypothetical protein